MRFVAFTAFWKVVCRDSEQTYVYFVHSFYLKAEDEHIVKATTDYSTVIHASVEQDNVFACQFHPRRAVIWDCVFYGISQILRRGD